MDDVVSISALATSEKYHVGGFTIPFGYGCMELRHLRYFVAVAEEQNITRAAARLHVSQPPLSRQIRDLEHELGVVLLERTQRAVRLTPAGWAFLEECYTVLRQAEQAVRVGSVRRGGRTWGVETRIRSGTDAGIPARAAASVAGDRARSAH